MPKIKFIGKIPCSVQLIAGRYMANILPDTVINVPQEDYDSLMFLGKETKEWESAEYNEEEKEWQI